MLRFSAKQIQDIRGAETGEEQEQRLSLESDVVHSPDQCRDSRNQRRDRVYPECHAPTIPEIVRVPVDNIVEDNSGNATASSRDHPKNEGEPEFTARRTPPEIEIASENRGEDIA